ncbi:MAG: amino acid permease [Aureliella sp.]
MWSKLFRRKDVESILAELQAAELAPESHRLAKSLTLFDLVCFGIAAIVGAGIFSTIGSAASAGGPAVSVLFVMTAVTCLFSALCYAEFAARIPVCGSAYTYSYAAFGELIAWIIGWDLLMEYAIGNSVLAFSWSEYFSSFLLGLNIDLPNWLETDYFSCARAVEAQSAATGALDSARSAAQAGLVETWNAAPSLGGLRVIVDVPALAIDLLVTCLVVIGIRESRTASNFMVILKLCIVVGVIAVGVFYVKPDNWSPFAPNGVSGVLHGIAAVFFAYIGFDAISTTAEECRNPQRDLPRATVITLIVCTVLYVAIALVLTGMVSYRELAVADPLAFVFQQYHLDWIAGIVSLSAIVAITSVFLVFQIGQPRIWMSMARDGLLPPRFAKIHPKYQTPAFSSVVTGLVVAVPILLLNQELVTDLCSIGTLFAFMLVSAGVLRMELQPEAETQRTFRVPYLSGRWPMLAIWIAYTVAATRTLPANHNVFTEISVAKIPYLVFYVALTLMTAASAMWRWSLIPVLGVLTNLYLIAGLGHHNWLRFILWCLIGLAIYFGYGFWHSRLNRAGVRE